LQKTGKSTVPKLKTVSQDGKLLVLVFKKKLKPTKNHIKNHFSCFSDYFSPKFSMMPKFTTENSKKKNPDSGI
jgi:hypothetical protein